MNASFTRYHLVNAYGVLGTVTVRRREVVVEGTDVREPDAGALWREYDFTGKPGDPMRLPRRVAPCRLRLDWQMWFLALGSPDTGWFQRMRGCARVYDYRFTTWTERKQSGSRWVRTEIGVLVPPVSLRD